MDPTRPLLPVVCPTDSMSVGDLCGPDIQPVSSTRMVYKETSVRTVKRNPTFKCGYCVVKRKTIFYGVAGLCALLAILIVIIAIVTSGGQQKKIHGLVCASDECVLTARELAAAIDPAVDPCQDFYQFACGGWIRQQNLNLTNDSVAEETSLDGDEDYEAMLAPEISTSIADEHFLAERINKFAIEFLEDDGKEADSHPVQMARLMYRTCLNHTDLIANHQWKRFYEYGGWPLITANWSASDFDWRKASVLSRTQLGLNSFLFRIVVSSDVDNPNANAIHIDVPNISRIATFVSVDMAFKFAQVMASVNNVDMAVDRSDVEEMLRFRKELIEIAKRYYENNSRKSVTYTPESLSSLKLQDFTNSSQGYIDWYDHLGDIFSTLGIQLESAHTVVIEEFDYLVDVMRLLDRTPANVIANYFHWYLVEEGYQSDMQLDESDTFSGMVMCMSKVKELLPFAVAAGFGEDFFDAHAKSEVTDVVSRLKASFVISLDQADWMDDETRGLAKAKLTAIKDLVAYPDWVLNRTALENYHRLSYDYLMKELGEDDILYYILSATQVALAANLKLILGKPSHEQNWLEAWLEFDLTTVNAAYWDNNIMNLFLGYLQRPNYIKGGLRAVSYGRLGVTIGHEITHAFDSVGHKYDKDGKRNNWWTANSLNEFAKRAQCVVRQYSRFEVTELGNARRINGTTTLAENIADIGGMRQAFRAYRGYVDEHGEEGRLPGLEQYSPEQIFFLASAYPFCSKHSPKEFEWELENDEHSPNRYRVLGTLQNSQEFAQAFQCPVDSPMNPKKKCVLW